MLAFLVAGIMEMVLAESGKALVSRIVASSLTSCMCAREKFMYRGMMMIEWSGALSHAFSAQGDRLWCRCSPDIPLTL